MLDNRIEFMNKISYDCNLDKNNIITNDFDEIMCIYDILNAYSIDTSVHISSSNGPIYFTLRSQDLNLKSILDNKLEKYRSTFEVIINQNNDIVNIQLVRIQ